jgi:hypothetical protein
MYNGFPMRFQVAALAIFASFLAAAARAQTLPPLDAQKTWTDADKAEFLKYLNSNAPLPAGSVSRAAPEASSDLEFTSRAARSLELGPATTSLFPYSGGHYSGTVDGGPGARVVFEQHYEPWMRFYAGLEGETLYQKERNGQTASLTRWAAPAGVEFALVPLSTPQTRYVLMRLGVAPAAVSAAANRNEFSTPILGASMAWDLGLGYEWQIPDSRWRINAAIDGLHSISNRDDVSYYGLGATLAVVYTF